nr:EF-hand domain-containing family member B-like [Vanessa tameamea]
MPIDCRKSTSGGKGNVGMYIERDRNICAAGIPTAQPNDFVADSLQHYLLKDEADALISDAIIPPKKPRPAPPLRYPIPLDKRFAGPFGQVADLINPPIKTKFQTLVDDFKDTPYSSYWKRPLGKVSDPVPLLPEGFDTLNTTFGKKTEFHGRLYDVVMPKEPIQSDNMHKSKECGVQSTRNYCVPAYNPDLTFGHRTFVDKRGTYARCCVTDDRILLGNSGKTIVNTLQSNFQDMTQPRIGTVLAPNDNISNLPNGYTFGKLKAPDNLIECLTFCKISPDVHFYRKCLGHLNSLRKYLSKRFLPTFFRGFYLNLKYFDTLKCDWLDKDVVYNACAFRLIRFDTSLIEPLLFVWKAFDGSKIKYKTFVYVINYKQPLPDIPKMSDIPLDCLDFNTTYTDMVKPGQEKDDKLMAGIPSGRYFDLDYPITPENCCRADRTCLPHESDVKACLNPSILTLFHVNHRDMFAKREPNVIRKVFEAAGESLPEEKFNAVWEDAKTYHSKGWVCYETFRRALENYSISNNNTNKNKQD